MSRQELVVMRGLPASGKTTWAISWVREDPDSRIRLNRDDLRTMMTGRLAEGGRYERELLQCRDVMARFWLDRGFSVVLDDTNLMDRDMISAQDLAKSGDAELVCIDFRSLPIDVCIWHDRRRGEDGERSVGEDVIVKLAERGGLDVSGWV